MYKYFEIFVKSIITATGITFVAGVCFTVKTLVTYSDTLNSIEKRISTIETYILNKK